MNRREREQEDRLREERTTAVLKGLIGQAGSNLIVESASSVMPQRGTLRFVGPGVVVTDEAGKTVVTISGGGGGGGNSYFPSGW